MADLKLYNVLEFFDGKETTIPEKAIIAEKTSTTEYDQCTTEPNILRIVCKCNATKKKELEDLEALKEELDLYVHDEPFDKVYIISLSFRYIGGSDHVLPWEATIEMLGGECVNCSLVRACMENKLGLKAEHLLDDIIACNQSVNPPSLPTSKPASPQIDFTSTPLNQYSLSCIARGLVVRSSPYYEGPTTVYCELVLDGASQGVKTLPIDTTFTFKYGDYDPLVSHHVQFYYWVDIAPFYVNWLSGNIETGTVSQTVKAVWSKFLGTDGHVALRFSDSGIYDLNHLFVDTTQVIDYDLWWSGENIIFKGTQFEVKGELIYQRMSVYVVTD